jgi:hypothetical protein
MKQLILLISIFYIASNTQIQAQTKKKKNAVKKTEKNKTNTAQTTTTTTTVTPKNPPSQQKNNVQTNEKDPLGLNLGNGSAIKKGTTVLDIGVGFNYYGIPIHASAEKLVVNNISVGLYGNIMSYSDFGFVSNNYSYYLIYAGVKGNYYFNELLGYGNNKYQLYAGLNIGYAKLITTDNSFNYNSRPFLGGQAGLRYFFNKKFGVYAEGDWSGQGGGTIGLSIKLK